jgi:four helix bundle protein
MGTELTIRDFTDLRAWQEAKRVAIQTYSITRDFPASEQFGLTNQMRRAAVSITANIAEGFARRTGKDKRGFYQTALASLSELKSHMIIARELTLMSDAQTSEIRGLLDNAGRQITGLIRSAVDR